MRQYILTINEYKWSLDSVPGGHFFMDFFVGLWDNLVEFFQKIGVSGRGMYDTYRNLSEGF